MAQLAGVPPAALLSVNTIAGNVVCGTMVGVPTKLRLLVSPVKPAWTQVGASLTPSFTCTLTTSVEPLLRLAWLLQQSPKMLNSACCQPAARLRILSAPGTPCAFGGLPTEIVTVSLPLAAAVAVRIMLDKPAMVWAGTTAPLAPFCQQLVVLAGQGGDGGLTVFHPPGRLDCRRSASTA